jgi:Sigma-70, region 4
MRSAEIFDYSLEEIAELVDTAVGGVKAALNRGRTKLAVTCYVAVSVKCQSRVGTNYPALGWSI